VSQRSANQLIEKSGPGKRVQHNFLKPQLAHVELTALAGFIIQGDHLASHGEGFGLDLATGMSHGPFVSLSFGHGNQWSPQFTVS
jgi:hypothetical protein